MGKKVGRKPGQLRVLKMEEAADICWRLHIEEGFTYKMMFGFFKTEYGYGKDYVYKIIASMQTRAREYIDAQNVAKLETQMQIGQENYLRAKERGDHKLAKEYWIELNKLFKLYEETHNLNINDFKAKF